MKTAIFVAATGFLLACTVFARLGETRAQIEARYGKPFGFEAVDDFHGVAFCGSYSTNGFDILVMFNSATNSVVEKISRAHRPGQFTDPTLSEEEIRAFLNANRGGFGWSAPVDAGGNTYRKRTDGAFAIYSHIQATLYFTNAEMGRRFIAEADEEKKKALSGF